MSIEVNKGIVERGFTEFWGADLDTTVIGPPPTSVSSTAPTAASGYLGGIEAKATLLILERAA